MKDVIKAVVVVLLYFGVAPALGSFLARRRVWERWVVALMVFMPSWFPGKLTLMIDSVEWYRGHTKGFEYSHLDLMSLALIIAARIRNGASFRLLPPGAGLWLLYCGVAFLSIQTADNKLFVLMAAVKFTKAVVIIIGFYHGFRDAEDLLWVQRSLGFTLFFQALVGLKLRFFDGQWQVKGWFEHQNPMAMWSYMCALPTLAAAFAPKAKTHDFVLYLLGVAGAALMILLSVSRGALGAFVAGAVAVTGMAWIRGPKPKVIGLTLAGGAAAALAAMVALSSLMARLDEVKTNAEEEDLRAVLIRQSRQMRDDSPYFGIGWNNYGIVNSLPSGRFVQIMMDWEESRGFRVYEDNHMANPLTESLYWLLFAETGYLGWGTFVLFEIATGYWAVRGTLRFWKSPTGWFLGAVTVALGLTYAHGTVERVLTQTKNLSAWLIFAAIIARVETCRREGHDLPDPTPPTHP